MPTAGLQHTIRSNWRTIRSSVKWFATAVWIFVGIRAIDAPWAFTMQTVVLLPPLVVIWYFDLRDPRPPVAGHCQRCAYNLTGNTSGRCPECGERCDCE